MKHDPVTSGKREPVNLALDTGVVAAAREMGIDLAQTCEMALRDAAKIERNRRWREENREWARAVNRWVQENDLPLEHLRLF